MTSMSKLEKPNTIPWPPIILVCTLAIGIIANGIYPLAVPVTPLGEMIKGLGIMLIIIAVLIDVAAMLAMRKANTTILPHKATDHLVTKSVFAFSRNPIYLANALLTVGIGLTFGTFWHLFLMPLGAFATQKLAIEREERHLESKFGNNYRSYAKRVNRWI